VSDYLLQAQRLFDLGDQLNTACEDCRREFWYPPS
jgi:hypothetical protein